MIIPLLLTFTGFALSIAIIGFFLKLSGAIEEETLFYYLSGLMLTIVALLSFGSGIQYETGANSTTVGVNTNYVYTYSNADLRSTSIVSLSLLTTGIFLMISGYTINTHRKKQKTEEEGGSSW